jgi:hypothetical protein
MHERRFPLAVLALVLFLHTVHSPRGATASAPEAGWSATVEWLGEEPIYSRLRAGGEVCHPGYVLSVKAVKGKTLLKLVYKHRDAQGKTDFVLVADTGVLRIDASRKYLILNFQNGELSTVDGSRGFFVDRTWELPLPPPPTGE